MAPVYSDKVLDHFKNPRNVGELDNPDGVGVEGNPVCGDLMEIQIKVEPAEEPPTPDVPTLSHPYLMAGVIGMLVVNLVLAVRIVQGRRKAQEVAS